jgi:hypothetical protein
VTAPFAITRVVDAPRGRVFAAPVPAVLVKLLRDKNPAWRASSGGLHTCI